MTRKQYTNQARAARAIARSITRTEEARQQTADLILRVVQHFNGHITGLTTPRRK